MRIVCNEPSHPEAHFPDSGNLKLDDWGRVVLKCRRCGLNFEMGEEKFRNLIDTFANAGLTEVTLSMLCKAPRRHLAKP